MGIDARTTACGCHDNDIMWLSQQEQYVIVAMMTLCKCHDEYELGLS